MELEPKDIELAVVSGWADDYLERILSAANRRQRFLAEQRASQVVIGSTVRIGKDVRPKALQGLLAEVVALESDGTIQVQLREVSGLYRWDRMSKIGLKPTMIGEVLTQP